MKQTRRIWKTVVVAMMACTTGSVARAAEDATTALNNALDLVEGYEARKAVAVLADAARRYPQDRKIGGLLYTLLRDKRWPVLQTLPAKLPGSITAMRFGADANLLIAGTEDGTVRVLNTETGEL